jgi:voltage-gated potassium channel Kch
VYTAGVILTYSVWVIWAIQTAKLWSGKKALVDYLIWCAFLLPFFSISFGLFGFQFSFFKIIPFVVIFYSLRSGKLSIEAFYVALYFSLVFIVSYSYIIVTQSYQDLMMFGRPWHRAVFGPVVQAFSFFCAIVLPFFIINKDQRRIPRVVRGYILGCLALVAIGFIQLLSYSLELPWFKHWFLVDAFGRKVDYGLALRAMSQGAYRMSSLGGEPRHFGAFLTLAIMLMIWMKNEGLGSIGITKLTWWLALTILLSGIVLSYSSSAVLALVIGLAIYSFFYSFKLFFTTTIISIFLYAVLSDVSLIQKLTWKLQSIEYMLYAAPKDAFALKAIFHNVWSFLFGYGINLAEYYVYEYVMEYSTPFGIRSRWESDVALISSMVPTSGILQLLSNGGVLGFFILGVLLFKRFRNISKNSRCISLGILGLMTVGSSMIFTLGFLFIYLILNYERARERHS